MDASEYRNQMEIVIAAARMLTIVDLPELIADIDRAEAVGPVLHPTLYRDRAKAMAEDREIFQAAMPLYTLAKKIEKGALERQGS